MLRLVFALAVGTWLGALVVLSFVVTPVAHRTFTPRDARRLLRPLFPRCYLFGVGCGFVALATVLLGRPMLPQSEALRLALPTAAAMACMIAGLWLFPRLRDLDGEDARFLRLHQVSAMLNSTAMGALTLAMAAAVMR
jgi:hypothetical protein